MTKVVATHVCMFCECVVYARLCARVCFFFYIFHTHTTCIRSSLFCRIRIYFEKNTFFFSRSIYDQSKTVVVPRRSLSIFKRNRITFYLKMFPLNVCVSISRRHKNNLPLCFDENAVLRNVSIMLLFEYCTEMLSDEISSNVFNVRLMLYYDMRYLRRVLNLNRLIVVVVVDFITLQIIRHLFVYCLKIQIGSIVVRW